VDIEQLEKLREERQRVEQEKVQKLAKISLKYPEPLG